jgi:hypothetical protein
MKTKQTKYIIRASYSYYSGTFNAPKNGAIRDCNGERLEFDTREQAVKFLNERCEENSDGSFSAAGTYYTAHGEYSRPVYRIRKNTL